MAVRTIWIHGSVPYTKNFGTLAELMAMAPSTEFAEGFASDFGRIDYVKGQGWMAGGKLLSDRSASFDGPIKSPNTPLMRPFLDNWFLPAFNQSSPDNQLGGYLNDSGVFVSNASFGVSHRIDVAPGLWFSLASDTGVLLASKGIVYRADGSIVGTIGSYPAHAGQETHYKMPAGGAYIKINFNQSAKMWVGVERTIPTSGVDSFTITGDSIVYGFNEVYSDKDGIPSRMAAVLGCRAYENLGQSGNTIAGVGGMHTRILASNPTYSACLLFGGINDFINGIVIGAANSSNTAEFNGALNAIGTYFSKRCWQRFFLCLPLYDQTHLTANANGDTQDTFRDAQIAAALRWGWKVIDVGRGVGIDPRVSAETRKLLYPDGLHPGKLGQTMIANYIAQQMVCG